MFIGNDPYVGALHQNDVQMAAPIFHDGEVVAWAGVMAHETDMGGMNFASWCPEATEVYQEGLRIPAVKLVDRGELRDDVLEMILAATRLPAALGLDIRAFIATLNVANESAAEPVRPLRLRPGLHGDEPHDRRHRALRAQAHRGDFQTVSCASRTSWSTTATPTPCTWSISSPRSPATRSCSTSAARANRRQASSTRPARASEGASPAR